MSDSTTPRFDTIAIHAGQAPDPTTGSRAVPIYQTVAYNFDSTEHAADLFGLREFGNIYTRIMNPTNDVLEQRLAALHGGTAAVAVASGHAAENLALLNLAGSGDTIVSSTSLYGGTWNIFLHTFKRLGITVRFVEPTDVQGFVDATDDTTKAWYVETDRQPAPRRSRHQGHWPTPAASLGVPLVVDNTFATPYLTRPIEHGAAVVIESLTKWIGGHGTSLGGIVVDGGNFDWGSGRFPQFTEPDASYHGLKFWDVFGDFPGWATSPSGFGCASSCCATSARRSRRSTRSRSFSASRRCRCASSVTRKTRSRSPSTWQAHPKVAWVTYPGLENHPTKANAEKYLSGGYGGVVVFGVKGGLEAGQKLIESVKLLSHLANVGDAKSLIIHPATTTHSQLSDEELVRAGIGPDFVRLSVGIEDVNDIIADLEQALEQV